MGISFISFFGITMLVIAVGLVLAAIAARIGDAAIDAGAKEWRFWKYLPRLTGWSFLAVVLLTAIGFIAPVQLPVVLYKVALVVIGAVLGYAIDRALYPKARPHVFLHPSALFEAHSDMLTAFHVASIRRALIVIACVLGLTMGL